MNIPASAFGLPSEEVWLSYVVIPKFGAVLSMIASTFLTRDVLLKWREKKTVSLVSLMLFGISVVNIFGTLFGECCLYM